MDRTPTARGEGRIDRGLAETFHEFGVAVLPGFFTADFVEALWEETHEILTSFYAHAPFDGSQRHWLPLLRDDAPLGAGLAEEPRVLDLVRSLFDDFVLFNVDTNRRVGDTYWHADNLDTPGVKLTFFAHPVDGTNGGIRFIPGSHHAEQTRRFSAYFDGHRPDASEVASFVPSLDVGDALIFDPRIWHATHGSTADRRMWAVTYYQAPSTDQAASTLRDLLRQLWAVDAGPAKFLGRDAAVLDARWLAKADEVGHTTRRELVEAMRAHDVLPPAGDVHLVAR